MAIRYLEYPGTAIYPGDELYPKGLRSTIAVISRSAPASRVALAPERPIRVAISVVPS